MQPLKMRTRHMPTKVTKPPKKGKGMKYNRIQQKKTWKKDVNESPDYVSGTMSRFGDDDARSFGYYKGKFYLADKGNYTHGRIGHDIDPKKDFKRWRYLMQLPGRVWMKDKVFSLWKYPRNLSEWEKLIGDLKQATGEDVVNRFYVEVAKTSGVENNERVKESIIKVSDLLDRIKKNKMKVQQRSNAEKNIQHAVSPMKKQQREVPGGLGSKKTIGGMSQAQYHNKRYTGDGVIKLGNILKEIKYERIWHLIKEHVGMLGWYFVIGPEGRVWNVGHDTHMKHHGGVVYHYPDILKKALDEFKSEEELRQAIVMGSHDLYSIMYNAGMIRCGKGDSSSWFAFYPAKVTSKALMKVLEICKEKKFEYVQVDETNGVGNSVGGMERMTVGDFIDKYM